MSNEATPSFDSFIFDQTDLDAIAQAKAEGGKVWDSERLKGLRARIKNHHLAIQDEQCCYCKRNLTGEFPLVVDVEHILPKRTFPELMFDIANLSVACKRCNMNIKGQKVDFVVDLTSVKSNHRHPHLYQFIHPNFDDYFAHLGRIECHVNGRKMVKYVVTEGSAKGKYTYHYFRLSELEIDSFDKAQGLNAVPPTEAVEEIRLKLAALRKTT